MKPLMLISLLFALAFAMPAWAVKPSEMLDDPELEARARTISKELRCVVCAGESVDESNAGVAQDLRMLVRERLVAGDKDQEVLDFIVARFGEYVLMTPTVKGVNLLLWTAGPVLFLLALIYGGIYVRRRSQGDDTVIALSTEEQLRLEAILKE